MMHLKHRFPNILITFFLIAGIGCANRKFEPIVIDGQQYCVTDEKTFSEEWYSCYLRGISCARCREEECLEKARNELFLAIARGKDDSRWVRTYGTHRLPEYFPNRELGVVYYYHYKLTGNPSDLDKAIGFLTTSLNQCPSAKAKYYLNKVRKGKLLLTGEDTERPQLEIDPFPQMTNNPYFVISGLVRDDTYVGYIYITLNHEEPLSLLELSQEFFCSFRQEIVLQPGINHLSIKAVDLMGREEEKKIDILLDQEGPMICFAQSQKESFSSPHEIKGVLYDPSEVIRFSINEHEVELIKVSLPEETQKLISSSAYTFHYLPTLQKQKEGMFHYRAIDALGNSTSGVSPILIDDHKMDEQMASNHQRKPFCIAMDLDSRNITSDYLFPLLGYQEDSQRNSFKPITINITQAPQETFEDEICPHINILAHHQIREIWINEKPVLFLYGLNLSKIFLSLIKKYLYGENLGRLSIPRIMKLKKGENTITVKVVDDNGMVWEKSIQVIKKIRQIYAPNERWRITIHIEGYNQDNNMYVEKKKSITQKLIKAFLSQERFWIVDFENLEKVIREQNLSHFIDIPYLGIRNHHEIQNHPEIMIDAFLLVYIQENQDSMNILGSLVDFETGVILSSQEVFEEINPQTFSDPIWAEGVKMHTYQICCVLTAKFKNYFPICEGSVISLIREEMKTTISENDGLKEKMKLIIYEDHNQREDFTIITEAKVREVLEDYSLAKLLEELENSKNDIEKITHWKVITR
jgi:hypothetical protein